MTALPSITLSTMASRLIALEMALRTRQSRVGLGHRGLPSLSMMLGDRSRLLSRCRNTGRFDGPCQTATSGSSFRELMSAGGTKSIRSTSPLFSAAMRAGPAGMGLKTTRSHAGLPPQ